MAVNTLFVTVLAVGLSAPGPGEQLRVRLIGAGPNVVLITGLLGSTEGFEGLAVELARGGRRAIIIEPLGVGRSARPRDADYSLSAQAERIAGVLDTLDVRRALVVGHAVSVAIAYRLAAARPDQVRAVVALEGGAPARAATPSLSRALRFAPLLRLLGGRSQVRRLFARELAAASADAGWVSDSVVTEYARGPLEDLGATIAAYRAMSRAREPMSVEKVLTLVRCPILMLRGEAGRVPESEVAIVRDYAFVVKVDQIDDAGVFLHEERPEAVAAAIAAFDPAETGAERSIADTGG